MCRALEWDIKPYYTILYYTLKIKHHRYDDNDNNTDDAALD